MSKDKIKCKNCPADVTKYYPISSPSPNGRGFAASYEAVGTRMQGGDNSMWEVREDKRGVRRWQRVSGITRDSKRRKSRSRSPQRAPRRQRSELSRYPIPRGRQETLYRVILAEPSAFSPSQFDNPETPSIMVSRGMINRFQKKPKSYQRDYGSDAYLFGKLFGLSNYELIGYQCNYAGKIGLIDEDENVLFEGDTFRDDIGAELWIHKNKNGLIDSVIIDNGYFFTED